MTLLKGRTFIVLIVLLIGHIHALHLAANMPVWSRFYPENILQRNGRGRSNTYR